MTTKSSNTSVIETISPNVTIRENSEIINLLTPRKKYKENKKEKKVKERCTICFDFVSGKKNISKTPCGHVFCLTCLHEHLKINHTCPNCRKPILSKKPKKPIIRMKKNSGIRMINNELRHYDMEYMLDHMNTFKDTAKHKLKCLFQEFGYEIVKQFLAFQINGADYLSDYEQESDEQESDEEEIDEEEIEIMIDTQPTRSHNRNRIIDTSDDDDEDSDDEAEFEA